MNRGVWVLFFLRILCCGWHCHTRPHIVLYLLWSCSGRALSSLGFFGTRNPRLPSSVALRFFRSTVLRFSYLPFCLPCCIRFFSKVQTRGRSFLLVAAQVVGSSVLVFLSSSVLAFLSSSVLWFFDSLSSSSLKLSYSEVLKHLYSQES